MAPAMLSRAAEEHTRAMILMGMAPPRCLTVQALERCLGQTEVSRVVLQVSAAKWINVASQ